MKSLWWDNSEWVEQSNQRQLRDLKSRDRASLAKAVTDGVWNGAGGAEAGVLSGFQEKGGSCFRQSFDVIWFVDLKDQTLRWRAVVGDRTWGEVLEQLLY